MTIDRVTDPSYTLEEGYYTLQYRIYYKDGSTKHPKIRGKRNKWKTKKQAKEHYKELKKSLLQQRERALYETVAADYLKKYKQSVIESSFIRERKTVEKLEKTFKGTDLNDWTGKQIQDYFSDIYGDYSGSELVKRYQTLKRISTHGRQFYHVGVDPFEFLKPPKKEKDDFTEDDFWSIEEYNKVDTVFIALLQQYAKERADSQKANQTYLDCLMARCMLRVLFWCGTRKGEILTLLESDLYEDSGRYYLAINKTLTSTEQNGKSHTIKYSTKTKSGMREIAIDKKTVELLQQLINEHKAIPGYDSSKAYLISTHGYITSVNKVHRTIEKYSKLAEVKYINPHKMRHSHGSVLLNNGTDIVLVSQRLGHSDIQTTLKVYVRIYKKRLAEVVDHIESIESKY